jgi:hypothetical protein
MFKDRCLITLTDLKIQTRHRNSSMAKQGKKVPARPKIERDDPTLTY